MLHRYSGADSVAIGFRNATTLAEQAAPFI
jgi:hypothetical protein